MTVREPDALGNHPQIPVDLEEGMAWGSVALSPCQFLTSEMQSRRSISGRFQRIPQRWSWVVKVRELRDPSESISLLAEEVSWWVALRP